MAPLLLAAALAAASVEVFDREPAPGEPLRIVVESPRPIASVSGTFAGEPLFFVRDRSEARWVAWAAVDLDAKAGPRRIEVTAVDSSGRAATSSRAVRIASRKFPTQKLTVEPKFVEPPPEARARIDGDRKRLAAVYARRTPEVLAAAPFARPVPGEPTSVFGSRRVFNGQPRAPHPGLDLAADSGTPVRAAADGEVVLAGDLYFSGNTVILDHGGGLFTVYAHLSRIDVAEGARRKRGEPLGLSGATGRVTGPHLHWGARIGDRIVDPRAFLDPRLFGAAR